MAKTVSQSTRIRERLKNEVGTIFKRGGAGLRVAMLYPSPYRVGMSSLGFQTIYRIINQDTDHVAERAFLPEDDIAKGALLTYESSNPVGDFDVIAVSLAYELELVGLAASLERAGLAALREERREGDPLVILGGPLTFSNPLPATAFADVIIMGEGEQAIVEVLEVVASGSSRTAVLERLAGQPGCLVPAIDGERLPPVLKADDDCLPAYSQIRTPDTELANMHLVEAERGCHRRCTFCVMRRSTNGGMRTASVERVLNTIPEDATRVGLVGAAVTDHPQLLDIIKGVVESGRGLGISSLRADRLTPQLVELLKQGGYRTLTVASDGATEALRKQLQKSIRARHLLRAAQLCADHKIRTFKVYMMLGVPGEQDDDIDELIDFCVQASKINPTALTVSPFVAKRNTPLDGTPFAGVDVVERRIKRLKRGVRGKIDLRSTSAKWAWVEYCLAQGGAEMGKVALAAHRNGGGFATWKRAIGEVAPRFLDCFKGRSPKKPQLNVIAASR